MLPVTLPPFIPAFKCVNDEQPIVKDPPCEDEQGQNLVKVASEAGVQYFLWSELPSSRENLGGKFVTKLYEGKHSVDDIARELGLPGAFMLTGNFYENMITRKYAGYDKEKERQVVKIDTDRRVQLYLEKDLGVCSAVFYFWNKLLSNLGLEEVM
ncbi:hypothetical protein BDV12DRAFT_198641 [Aspergillus spectabilis]